MHAVQLNLKIQGYFVILIFMGEKQIANNFNQF